MKLIFHTSNKKALKMENNKDMQMTLLSSQEKPRCSIWFSNKAWKSISTRKKTPRKTISYSTKIRTYRLYYVISRNRPDSEHKFHLCLPLQTFDFQSPAIGLTMIIRHDVSLFIPNHPRTIPFRYLQSGTTWIMQVRIGI